MAKDKIWNLGFALTSIVVLIIPLLSLGNGSVGVQDYRLEVTEGEVFEIEIREALTPFYDWELTEYDQEYLQFIDVIACYLPPENGTIGITIKLFRFRTLKPGITEITFTYCEVDINGEPVEELESREYGVTIYPFLPLEFEFNGAIYVQTWGILIEGVKVMEFGEVNGLIVYALEGIVHKTPPQLFIQNEKGDYVIYVRGDMIGQEVIPEEEAVEISGEVEAVKKLIEINENAYPEARYIKYEDGELWEVGWWTPENFGYPWVIVLIDAGTGAVKDVLIPKGI